VAMLAMLPGWARAAPVEVVAAERAYADIAAQLGGADVHVTALLTNPAVDPHEFEPVPSTARAMAAARILVENGLGYDSWMARLPGAPVGSVRIVVGNLLHRTQGANPHLWFDPAAMPALVRALVAALQAADPGNAPSYLARGQLVLASLDRLQAQAAALRVRFGGTRVAATEPVFGLMAGSLGLVDPYQRLELALMNGSEPRASDVVALQGDIAAHRVRVLFTNAQSAGPASAQLQAQARAAGIPIVPVAETQPLGQTYQAWIGATLRATQAALSAGK
jgi:zinc/manganese transport system substrate-binding protein